MQGTIFDIQHYALYDGPGIRTVVFFKGCPLRCAWCHNPESQRLQPEVGYVKERCTRCGNCEEACPNGAVRVGEDGARRDPGACRTCGECAGACPTGATEVIGRQAQVADVVAEVLRDAPFYENSGGGLTLSGGEPTMQPRFLASLMDAAREAGIHSALETCGHFDRSLIGKLVEATDLFLFDIKHIDPSRHKAFTGVGNDLILENFKEILELAGAGAIVPRIPLIPGFNSDIHSVEDIAAFLEAAGYGGAVHVMPYNRLARTKYEKVGRGEDFRDMGELTEADLAAVSETLARHSFEVVCNE